MIEIRKVRGKDEIKPIRLNQIQCKIFADMGYTPQQAINKLVAQVAKKRRWTWWFAKQTVHGIGE